MADLANMLSSNEPPFLTGFFLMVDTGVVSLWSGPADPRVISWSPIKKKFLNPPKEITMYVAIVIDLFLCILGSVIAAGILMILPRLDPWMLGNNK